jgi:hypothetical protein
VKWSWQLGFHCLAMYTSKTWHSEVGRQVKSTGKYSQITMWTLQFRKVDLRNGTGELGKIANWTIFHYENSLGFSNRWFLGGSNFVM